MTLKLSKDTLRPTTRNTGERNDNQESNQMENDLWPQAEEISMNPQNIDHVERPPGHGSLPCWNNSRTLERYTVQPLLTNKESTFTTKMSKSEKHVESEYYPRHFW